MKLLAHELYLHGDTRTPDARAVALQLLHVPACYASAPASQRAAVNRGGGKEDRRGHGGAAVTYVTAFRTNGKAQGIPATTPVRSVYLVTQFTPLHEHGTIDSSTGAGYPHVAALVCVGHIITPSPA